MTTSTEPAHDPAPYRDSGFGLIEAIVAMVLLGLLAMAFFPLAAQATKASRSGSTLATATRLVSGQMEVVRASTVPGCLPDWQGNGYNALVDPQGVTWRIHADVTGTCPAQPITYTVWVTRSTAPTVKLATASTTLWADLQ
jgi:prepilin-type N-terminal cleavage/methylation domain-containing protein